MVLYHKAKQLNSSKTYRLTVV